MQAVIDWNTVIEHTTVLMIGRAKHQENEVEAGIPEALFIHLVPYMMATKPNTFHHFCSLYLKYIIDEF